MGVLCLYHGKEARNDRAQEHWILEVQIRLWSYLWKVQGLPSSREEMSQEEKQIARRREGYNRRLFLPMDRGALLPVFPSREG